MCTQCTHCVACYYSEIIAQDIQWNEQILDCLYCQMRSFRSIFLHTAKALRWFLCIRTLWLDSMWNVPVCAWRCFHTLRNGDRSTTPYTNSSSERYMLFYYFSQWIIDLSLDFTQWFLSSLGREWECAICVCVRAKKIRNSQMEIGKSWPRTILSRLSFRRCHQNIARMYCNMYVP